MHLPRRTFLATVASTTAAAALAPGRALAQGPAAPKPPQDLDVVDINVPGDRALGRRFVLLVPRHLARGERVPLLVLLHGLGETGDERMGVYAWLERYGLGTAYDRLRRPPVARTSRRRDFTDARLAEVNAALGARPFRGFAIACPFTQNINKAPRPAAALDEYARWIAEVVVPRARSEANAKEGPENTAIDGCSLGGFIGLEVFLRRPELFGAWGGVQAAIGAHRATSYADRIAAAVAKVGARTIGIHIETSEADPFRDANVALSKKLTEKGVVNELLISPGPHDQPWLRESGTLEMLLWHDRRR